MFSTSFVLKFMAGKNSTNVFMDDNKSVDMSLLLDVDFPPIWSSSSCDLLCYAASLAPQPPSTGRRLSSCGSIMWDWRSNCPLTEKQQDTFRESIWFLFLEKYQRWGREVSCFSSMCPAGLDRSHVGRLALAKSTPGFRSSWLQQGLGFWCCSLICSGMLCGTCLTFF